MTPQTFFNVFIPTVEIERTTCTCSNGVIERNYERSKHLIAMASFPFGLLEEPDTRKPSKVRVVLFILVVLLFLLSITFIVLFVVEKTKANDFTSDICSSRACTTSAAGMVTRTILCIH